MRFSVDALSSLTCGWLAPLAAEAQQHQEEIDEIEIERERSHQGLLGQRVTRIAMEIDLLDALRVPGGKTGEDDDAYHRDRKLQRARSNKHIHDGREDDPDQAHE